MNIWYINLFVEINTFMKNNTRFLLLIQLKFNWNLWNIESLTLRNRKSSGGYDRQRHWKGNILYIRRQSLNSRVQAAWSTAQLQANMTFACAVSQSEFSKCPIDRKSRIFPIWSAAPFSLPTGRRIVEYPRVGICRWSWHRRLHRCDDDSRRSGHLCVVWCSRRYPWIDRKRQPIVRGWKRPFFRRKRFLSIFGFLVTANVHVLDIFMLRGWQEEVVCNLLLENFRFGGHLQMKCFENYFEKNNCKIYIKYMYENYFKKNTYKISNIRVTYMRGMECFIQEGHVLGGNIWQWDTTNENNNDHKLKWYNTNKIVIHENNVDTFIFFGRPSTLIELARLVVMFPIRFGCVWFKYYLQLISQRQNFLHLSNTLANESAPRNPWRLHTPEHVIRQPGGDSAAARRLGGSAAARPWQRHAYFHTRLFLIAIVAIPPMATPRQCGKRTLATELRPWLRVHSHAIVTIPPRYCYHPPFDRLSKPEGRGVATLLLPSPTLLLLSLVCSPVQTGRAGSGHTIVTIPHTIVRNAHYSVQRPLLCLTPTIVFNAHFHCLIEITEKSSTNIYAKTVKLPILTG